MVNVPAYAKTENIGANVVRANYKTKESEAMLHHHNHPRRIGIHYHKNATNKNQISYKDMKNILDKINRADEIQANLELDKTELGKHEVELATIKILEDDALRMKKGLDKLKALRLEMRKTYLDAIDKANTNWGDFKQKAKELGLDPNDFPLVKSFVDRQRELDDAFYLPNKL